VGKPPVELVPEARWPAPLHKPLRGADRHYRINDRLYRLEGGFLDENELVFALFSDVESQELFSFQAWRFKTAVQKGKIQKLNEMEVLAWASR